MFSANNAATTTPKIAPILNPRIHCRRSAAETSSGRINAMFVGLANTLMPSSTAATTSERGDSSQSVYRDSRGSSGAGPTTSL